MKFKDFVRIIDKNPKQISEEVDYGAFEKHNSLIRRHDEEYQKAQKDAIEHFAKQGIDGKTVEGYQQIVQHALKLYGQREQEKHTAMLNHIANQPPRGKADYGAYIQKTYYSGPPGSRTGD